MTQSNESTKTGTHIVVLIAILIVSLLVQSAFLTYMPNEAVPILVLTTLLTIAAGYFRPYLSKWVRWITLFVVSMISSLVCKDLQDIPWCAMLMCVFSLTVAIRRMVVTNRIADKSAMRELYNALDGSYTETATKIDNSMKWDAAKNMIPVAHAAAIMSFSLMTLLFTVNAYKAQMAEWGYYVYGSLIVVVSIIYAIRNTKNAKDFLINLLAALIMMVVGILVMFACMIIAILAIVFISKVLTAISNLLHKLFGRD